jgi:asparagine synthase (glutamine-hydrolysing)
MAGMCGITGWVDFHPEPRQRPAVLRAMTDTLACRGPDASGIWLDQHAALGHRRLSVIDPEGGRQPMRARCANARDEVVLVYSGEVYNYRELRAELKAEGRAFRTDSDTEVVLQAYLVWGEEAVERLNGMFAFALWDGSRDALVLARDRLGIKPLYYAPTSAGAIFGSEIKALLEHPEVEAVVDGEGLAELLCFGKTPGLTCYRGLYELRPGHTLVVREDREPVPRRYWSLEAHKHREDLPATVARVRELLEDIVERQLIADVPVCTLLSGGLDSSAITALAARSLGRQRRGHVRSYAVDFAGRPEDRDAAAGSLRGTLDPPYARLLAAHVGARHEELLLDPAQLCSRDAIDRVVRARDLPGGLGEGDTSLYLLFQRIREQAVTVALSGEAADEVFGGYRWFHDEAAVRAETFPWLAGSGGGFSGLRTPNSPYSFLDPGLLSRLRLREYVADRYREALAEVPRLAGESARERRMREVGYLHLTRFLPVLLDRQDRMSMAAGLEVRVPFCDHRLVEYVFNVPWELKAHGGREKSLLRAAVRDLLPAEVAERPKSPYPSTNDPGFAEGIRGAVREVLADPDSPALALLDAAAARRAVESAAGPEVRMAGELVLLLDSWLRQYQVKLEA